MGVGGGGGGDSCWALNSFVVTALNPLLHEFFFVGFRETA